jgi:hypothetical protein
MVDSRTKWYRCSSQSVGTGGCHSHTSNPISFASTCTVVDLLLPGGPAPT